MLQGEVRVRRHVDGLGALGGPVKVRSQGSDPFDDSSGGASNQSDGGGRGDQCVTVRVVTPKSLTPEQKDLLRKLGDSFGDSGIAPKKKSIFGGK